MSEYRQLMNELGEEVKNMPLEEQTLWNESCINLANMLEKYPGLLSVTSRVFMFRLLGGKDK